VHNDRAVARQRQNAPRSETPFGTSAATARSAKAEIAEKPVLFEVPYSDFKAQSPANIEISQSGAENILAQFPGGSQRLEDYVDASLLAALQAEGYFTAVQQKYSR
jgi:hypothetical protein